MTSAVIIRNARKRAGLTQTELAKRLGKSQSEIGRWERCEVRPSFETLQRIVRACDLDLVAHTYNADDSYQAQIAAMLRLAPEQRLDHIAQHVRATRTAWTHRHDHRPYDPVATLRTLDGHGVEFILIGGVAANLHGSPLPAEDMEITPSPAAENRQRLDNAIREITSKPKIDLGVVTKPRGSQGYADLRREATEFAVGDGVRVQVASVPDLIRMMEASGRQKDAAALPAVRAVLDRD